MAVQLPPCVSAFIITILCGNAIAKGAFITLLNSLIVQLDAEISILLLQIQRLNVLNAFLSARILAVNALIDKVSSDLNLFLEPFQNFQNCTVVNDLNKFIQSSASSKKILGLRNKLYELNRASNRLTQLQALKDSKEQLKQTLQAWLDKINEICP